MTIGTSTAVGVFDRILVGIDGTPESLEAARQAERLRSEDGMLLLAAVAEVKTAVHAGYAMADVLDEIEATAREGLRHAVEEVSPASAHLLAGARVACLLDEVERTKATLVAVGPRGHSRAAGMILGGVASELLHQAPCSVLFAREPRFGEFPSSIIAGVDGSPGSLAAGTVAESIAKRFGSELVVVAASGGKEIGLDVIQKRWPLAVIDPGHAVDVLSELSKEADLLVVGSRGLHGLTALGSVSERVAHWAASSVLVVRNL